MCARMRITLEPMSMHLLKREKKTLLLKVEKGTGQLSAHILHIIQNEFSWADLKRISGSGERWEVVVFHFQKMWQIVRQH